MTVLRADAQRNLNRVLEAATEAFAEFGADVSVDEIARRAGVGHATVFRRFPTKEALIAAVVLARVGAI
jgi:AcrR family transcriptional regulator